MTAGPKPSYVPVKKPLLARRGVQIGILAVVVLAAAGSISAALWVKHQANKRAAEKDAQIAIVRQFDQQVSEALGAVGQKASTTFVAFQSLTTDLAGFKSGDLSPSDAEQKADDVIKNAKDAYDAILKIQVAVLIQGHADISPGLPDAQTQIGQALQLYQQVGESFKLAAQAEGKERKALIAHTESLAGLASQIFSSGYQKLVNEQSRLGIFEPAAPPAFTPPPAPVATTSVTIPSGNAGAKKNKHTKK